MTVTTTTRRYRVTHVTRYTYSGNVSSGHTMAHLLTRATPTQYVHAADIAVDPVPDHRHTHIDVFGNLVSYLAVQRPHDQLQVTATSEVTITVAPPWEPGTAAGPPWEQVPDRLTNDVSPDGLLGRQCTFDSALVTASPALADYARPSFPPDRPIVEAVVDLTRRIHTDFHFQSGFTDITTPALDVLANRRGVCQDFAHLAIGCLRSLGLPARYVSGYIETTPPSDGPRLVGSDTSHAWCSAYVPGGGWFDVDPTNDHAPIQRHVTVAWGRDFADVSPLHGVVFGYGAGQELAVAVDVVRL